MPTFLENYREYVKGNEAHPNHHMWCALVALSSIVSRRVHIDMGYFRVYANLYVVLVAPPGGRKTTAMSIAKNLLRELKDIPFSAESITKEAIVGALKVTTRSFTPAARSDGEEIVPLVYCPLTICVTELSEFIGASRENMINFLTTIYDQDVYDATTIKRGEEKIIGPYLVLLGCTTPAWITARLRDDVISGGFSRRAIFVYEAERGARIPFPKVTAEMSEAWHQLVAYGQELLKVSGVFVWEADAHDWFEKWYMGYEIPKDPMLTGYYETKHMQLVKVAMLMSLSESTALKIEKRHLEMALAFLENTEVNLPKVFQGIGRNELNGLSAKLYDLIVSAGGKLPYKKAMSIMFAEGTAMEIEQIITHLVNSDKLVKAAMTITKGGDKPITVNMLYTPDAFLKAQQEQALNQKPNE